MNSSKTGSIISSDLEDHLKQVETLSNLLANPLGYKYEKDTDQKLIQDIKTHYENKFVNLLYEDEMFKFTKLNEIFYGKDFNDKDKVASKIQKLANIISSNYGIEIEAVDNIDVSGAPDYYFRSTDEFSHANIGSIPEANGDKAFNYIHKLITGQSVNIFSSMLTVKDQGKYSKEKSEKIDNSKVVQNIITEEKFKGVFKVKTKKRMMLV